MNQAQQSELTKAARERYWEECSEAEKLERLRQAIVSLAHQNETTAQTLAGLMSHQHGAGGELLTTLHQPGANLSGALGRMGGVPYSLRTERERDRY